MKDKITYNQLLEPDTMIRLYSQGAFPMAEEDGEIHWYYPEIRTIIPLDNYNVPRSLKQTLKRTDYSVRYDSDKMKIIRECASRNETWISPELIEAYKGLDERGYIHSVGIYDNDELIGGLYGVTFRGAFFGESMFSKISQASKIALVKLLEHLNERGFILLDVQFITEHLKMFGAVEISLQEYNNLLIKAYGKDVSF